MKENEKLELPKLFVRLEELWTGVFLNLADSFGGLNLDFHFFKINNKPMNQNNLATKNDLKSESKRLEDRMDLGFKKVEDKMEEMYGQIISAVGKGFEETATKEDLKGVEKKLEGRIDKLETEVMYIKESVNDLKADTPTDQEFKNHEKRIVRLEQKIFAS